MSYSYKNAALGAYPVGTYLWLDSDISPAEQFGGTWEQITDGRMLIAAGSSYAVGTTGGSTTHTHTLSSGYAVGWMNTSTGKLYLGLTSGSVTSDYVYSGGTAALSTTTNSYAIRLGGSSGSTSNMPPYLAAYLWHRIA
ncbi:MAG: hypothetical protein LUD19_06525 [Clostridia bacterium]|nr:hypothetical protein [Clostridia bacterium]